MVKYNQNNDFVVNILIISSAIFIRWTISLNSFSGEGNPPLFGDYEAQRHWMEITYNLPISNWYKNSTDNDLQYWGLDYPPLTAYHSWLCGYISNMINSSWVKLHISRGHESKQHKLFMRYSVFLADLLLFIPSIFAYFHPLKKNFSTQIVNCYLTLVFLYPGLILIDYGHFQYNCISLGLTILAVYCLSVDWNLIGSILYVLSLNYKQMELYHSIPFFSYLLGNILTFRKSKARKFLDFLLLSMIVILTFAICWLPFLFNIEDTINVLKRLFPVGRGLFEDKVANFWCSISIILKLKNLFEYEQIFLICSFLTLSSVLPSALNLIYKPSIQKFKYSLLNCSLAFFLFSYHVHEKTILIPVSSIWLLFPYNPIQCFWFLQISTFSMLPLFVKDNITLPFITSSILFFFIYRIFDSLFDLHTMKSKFIMKSMHISLIGCVCIGAMLIYLPPPARLPHIYIMIHSIYCCAHFLFFLVYFNWCQYRCDRILINEEFTAVKNKIK